MRTTENSKKGISRERDPRLRAGLARGADKWDDAREKELIERCKSGDSLAWNLLIRRYETPVFKYAYVLSHSREDADDIAGQAFLRLYVHINTFRSECSFVSWLFRIVRNTYVDMCLRSKHRDNVSLDTIAAPDAEASYARQVVDPSQRPETRCIEKEKGAILARAVRHLPAPQREVVSMFYSEGKSYDAIAASTGLSVGTIKSRLNRARTMLRERLAPVRETLTVV